MGAKMEQAGMGIGAEGGNSTPQAPLREVILSPKARRAEIRRLEKITAGARKRQRATGKKKK